MKYFGKRSLSSALSVILDILWYVVLVAAIGGFIAGVVFIVITPESNSGMFGNPGAGFESLENVSIENFQEFMAIPLFLRIFMLPYLLLLIVCEIFKTGKAKAVRITTLDAICRELECQPGDLLEYEADEK